MIEFKNLTKSFHDNIVLNNVEGRVKDGKTVVLLGPSGSGKSTLLRCMNLMEIPDQGSVIIDGQDITACRKTQKEAHKIIGKMMGMVFQHFHLFPHLTVLENITFAPKTVLGIQSQDARQQALDLLKKVGLEDKADAYPSKLSGGQKQRVAIARSLAMHPKIMLFDEPTSALDPEMVKEVLDVIKSLQNRSALNHTSTSTTPPSSSTSVKTPNHSMTMVIVTHEMKFAKDIADEIWFLDQGQIIEKTDPETFFTKPKTKRAQTFLSKIL